MDARSRRQALEGIRIVDFSWVLAGPFTTRLLADFGAEVIKIQPLLPEARDRYSRAYYNTWNRNKTGLALDLSRPRGQDIIRRLIEISDAVVENFSPRVMTNWGLDYPELRKIKPDIILLSLSVMGHSGPRQDYSGFGPAVQAFAGLTALTGYSAEEPVGAGFAYSDHVAGLYGALALQGALEYRDRCGQGQFIDLSQTEALISLLADPIFEAQQAQDSVSAPRQLLEGVFPCRGTDRWVAVSVSSEPEWQALVRVLEATVRFTGCTFSTVLADPVLTAGIREQISGWTTLRSAEEAALGLRAAGLAAAEVKDSADLANDPDLAARGFWVHLEHPEMGDTISDACPIRLSETPAVYRRAAPLRGQDNLYVLGELLGMSVAEIRELESEGVIGQGE